MRRTDDWLATSAGVRLARTVWEPGDGGAGIRGDATSRSTPGKSGRRGGVLLIHGMAEHRRRYEDIAAALARRGFLVWVYDQRGHGDTPAGSESRRHIAPGDAWSGLVDDARGALRALAAEVGTDSTTGEPLPLCALGHSMGSLVLRDVLRHPPSPVCAAVLMGTAGPGGLKAAVGHVLSAFIAFFSAPSRPSRLLDRLTFGAYNKRIADAATRFDWLSRDREEVERYLGDPHCGEVMSASFFRELTRGMMRVSSAPAFSDVPPETSILLASGTEDPVGDAGRGVREIAERFRSAGHPRVEISLRAGARHELLHETDREEATAEIVYWLEQKVAACQRPAD